MTADRASLTAAQEMTREMQSDWFIREVKKCRELGMPIGCCGEWPECSHVLAWVDSEFRRAAEDDA